MRARKVSDPAELNLSSAGKLLAEHHFLSEVDPQFRLAMIGACRWLHLDPGDAMTTAGDPCDGIYGIGAGSISVVSALGPPDSPMGHIICAGEWYGMDAIFACRARTASSVARTSTLVAHLSMAAIDRLAAENPDTWRNLGIMEVVNARLITSIAVDLMISDARRRCFAALLRLAGCRFASLGNLQPIVTVNQEELAGIANLSRNTANKLLRHAEDEGLVEIRYSAIKVLDVDRLRSIVDD